MIRKYLLPILAVLGVLFSVFVVVKGNKPMPSAPPASDPSLAPFPAYVAGTGIIEASTNNISIATELPGVIKKFDVKVGDHVKAGAPLFELDDRNLQATLAVQKAALKQSQDKLDRLASEPRPEEIPPAEALASEAQATFEDAQNQLHLAQSLSDPRALSREELTHRQQAFLAAQWRLKNAQATLSLLRAGAWKPDVEIAKGDVEYARAQVQATQTELDRLTVRAPVDGQVLQINSRVGEFAQTGPLATPIMLFGNVDTLYVRVEVDENEAWRVRDGAPAVAFVRGNREFSTPLKFVRIEPYVVPKKSLTGDSSERVDTRVLEVIYSFERGSMPVYVGQQMDIYIQAADRGAATRPSSPQA